MLFKQSAKELDANFEIIKKAWLPAVLDEGPANLTMIAVWVAERHTGPDGLVDCSAQAMSDAINALTPALRWKVAPVVKMFQGCERVTNYAESINDETAFLKKETAGRGVAAAIKREEEAIQKVIRDCETAVRRAPRETPALSERLREDLQEIMAGPTGLSAVHRAKTNAQKLAAAQSLLKQLNDHTASDVHIRKGALRNGW